MPRACLSNARFLASADSPLLPLLAPRVFAEAPFPGRSARQNGRRAQEEQEKERGRRKCDKSATKVKNLEGGNSIWKEHPGTCLKTTHHDVRGGSLAALSCSVPRFAPLSHRGSNSLGSRYVDIFSFARQQMRNYSTEDVNGTSRTIHSKDHRIARRRRASRANGNTIGQQGHRRNTGETEGSAPGVCRNSSRRRPLPESKAQSEDETLMTRRRRRMLYTARKRMSWFLSNIRTRDRDFLMKLGRYRSLRRRLYNFSREKSGTVDLRENGGALTRSKEIIRATAALDRLAYPGIKRRTAMLTFRHDHQCPSWAARLFKNVGADGEEKMWNNWMEFPKELRDRCWPYLLFYLLHRTPHRALYFLRIIAHQPHGVDLKPEILADALGHLARLHIGHLHVSKGQRADLMRDRYLFVPTFYHILEHHLSPYPQICSQDLLLNIARLADGEELTRVFDLLRETKTHLLYDTFLHYANTFAAAGEHQYALRCLKAIWERTADPEARQTLVNREKFRWTCALILRKSTSNGENYHQTTGIVAAFVELGVQLDILLYNVIMRNAMEAGDYATAFRVYNTLEENGLKPNKHTFSILLYGCTTTGDPAKFQDFAEYCFRMAKEMKDPWLATDYLYYLYVRHQKAGKDVQQGIPRILEAYLELFSMAPLEPFRSVAHTMQTLTATDDVDSSTFSRMEPSSAALYIMLQLEIQSAAATSARRVRRLYDYFKYLVHNQHHPVLTSLAKDTIIWNAFLLAFCRKQQYASASALIADMTKNGPQPNIYSWNIFMQAFFITDQVKAAERVYEIMRSRGIEPDQFTYGVLLRGYAKAQHIQKIGETMEHVDNEQQLDPQLLQALARVQKRKWLTYTLERSRMKKEQDDREKVAQKAEQERKRWRAPSFSPILALNPKHGADAPATEPIGTFGSEYGFKSVITQEQNELMKMSRPRPARKAGKVRFLRSSSTERRKSTMHSRPSQEPSG